MKAKTLFSLILILAYFISDAQKKPLEGSGKIITLTPSLKDFTAIELLDLDGKIQVEAGKSFSIDIKIDDNLLDLLETAVKSKVLSVKLKGNLNNKLYIENTNINIVIKLPALTAIKHRGNDYLTVTGITGNSFSMHHSGNGNMLLAGNVDDLEIKKSGNGNINAKALFVQNVIVRSSGNGDVIVNAEKNFKANGSGNGNIQNTGRAIADYTSSKSGNGDIVDNGSKAKVAPYSDVPNDKNIKTRIKNTRDTKVSLTVVYPVKGSYGISISGGGTRKEYFPLGTKIYKDGIMGQLLFEITPENRDTTLEIK